MKNYTKSVLCKWVSGVMAVIATITLALGYCGLDSADITVPCILVGIGYATALICFLTKKLYYHYRREAKKERERAVRLEDRRRKTCTGDYTKLSA